MSTYHVDLAAAERAGLTIEQYQHRKHLSKSVAAILPDAQKTISEKQAEIDVARAEVNDAKQAAEKLIEEWESLLGRRSNLLKEIACANGRKAELESNRLAAESILENEAFGNSFFASSNVLNLTGSIQNYIFATGLIFKFVSAKEAALKAVETEIKKFAAEHGIEHGL